MRQRGNKIWVVLVCLLVMGFVVAVNDSDGPSVPGGDDYGEVKGAIDNYTPINEEGKFDFEKFKPLKSKAEERIEGINLWIADNASWLAFVFGMVPEISWLFAINFLIWLLLFVNLFMNAPIVVRKTFPTFKKGTAYVMGAVVFVLVISLKTTYALASIFDGLLNVWWGKLILVVLLIFGNVIANALMKFWDKQILQGEKKQEEENREVLEKTVEGITG